MELCVKCNEEIEPASTELGVELCKNCAPQEHCICPRCGVNHQATFDKAYLQGLKVEDPPDEVIVECKCGTKFRIVWMDTQSLWYQKVDYFADPNQTDLMGGDK